MRRDWLNTSTRWPPPTSSSISASTNRVLHDAEVPAHTFRRSESGLSKIKLPNVSERGVYPCFGKGYGHRHEWEHEWP